MQGLAFEWDGEKEKANRRKHNVGFADASTLDPDHAAGEERFLIVGMSSERKLLVVVHTMRGARIRIISARIATQHERRSYEETPL